MITYKEKDKLATYILSIGLIDFNIKYKEVFPDEEISKNEFFLILRQFVDMGLLSRSKEYPDQVIDLCKVRQILNVVNMMRHSARKSFAQYASEIGIPDGVIDYCLGHSDKSKGVIRYYTKVKQQQADIAISRVIDYVNNPEKYKDYIEMRKDIMMMRG